MSPDAGLPEFLWVPSNVPLVSVQQVSHWYLVLDDEDVSQDFKAGQSLSASQHPAVPSLQTGSVSQTSDEHAVHT